MNNGRNLEVVQLEKAEMAVPIDTYLAQLDPLRATTRLLQVVNHAVIIRHVRAGVSRQRDVRHGRDLGELARRLGLQDAATLGERVLADDGGVEVRRAGGGRLVVDLSVSQTPRAGGGAANGGGAVAGVGLEGDGGGLEIDVAGDQRGAIVGQEHRVQCADRVRDEEGRADQLEKRAAGGAHGELLGGEVGGEGDEGGLEGVEVGVTLQTGAGPLRVVLRLRVGVCELRDGKALLADFGGRADTEREVGEVFLASAADGGLVEKVDLITLVQEVGSEALAVIGGVEPCLRCRE